MGGIIVIIVIVMILLDDLVQQPFGFLFESPNIRSYVFICLQWLGLIEGLPLRNLYGKVIGREDKGCESGIGMLKFILRPITS